ncbi:MAG TPA: ChaN family lipoprotein [Noviherbaspirillum sp.]|jgi:uncharacterized iron-regulated protein|uniref:ChaN family lipoprotein n=1 Tax=Noviherbaspirillum sp. TaxID=1926288 RepID=UPI002F9500F0
MKIKRSLLFICMLVAAAGAAAQSPHPLDGRIWDTRSSSFISVERAHEQAAASRHLLLGERHDSEIHHRLQRDVLQALAQKGRRPTVVMEQFDREHQPALAAAQAAGIADAEGLADAGKLDRKAWRWPMYKDLIGFAAARGWPLAAGNLSRADAREIATGRRQPALPEIGAAAVAALEEDIVSGHCGHRPPPDRLASIVLAQRARDAVMADALEASAAPTVLIAGAGHVRRDRAVPRYLKDGRGVLAIAYVETVEGKNAPGAYDGAGFDLLWFTPATRRDDPCSRPLTGTVASHPPIAKEKP